MEKYIFDVIIIGGGPAGLTAGLYAARAGLRTAIIEKTVTGGAVNTTPDVANFPGFIEISGYELGAKMHEQAAAAGVEFIFDEIENIDFDAKTINCSMAVVNYAALIIATGASPRKLNVEGEERYLGSGVHTCALCDGAFYKGKRVVVVGGGNSAVEESLYLSAIAAEVTMVNIAANFNAQQVLVDKLSSVTILHEHKVTKILGDKKLRGLEIQDIKSGEIKTAEADGIFVAIGRVPNTELFRDKLELSKNGYIIADQRMQTSTAGVFAAGDVIDKRVYQIVTACADGAIAATHAAEFIRTI